MGMHKSSGKNSNQEDFSHGRVNFFHYALDKIKNKDNLLLTLGVTYLYGLGDQKIDYKKSFNYMLQASNAGSKTAMGYLAKMYISKLPGIEYDIEKALSYAQTLMKANRSEGFFVAGHLHHFNLIENSSLKMAIDYYKQSLSLNEESATLRLLSIYFDKQSSAYDLLAGLEVIRKTNSDSSFFPVFMFNHSHQIFDDISTNCKSLHAFLVLLLNRLEVTKTLKLAYDDLNMRKYDSALLYFAEMAEIGIESAQANFIYMLDRKMFSKSKFNVSNLMRLREKYMLACSANLNKFLLHLLGDELLTGKGSFEKDELAAANIFTEGANSLKDTESIYHLALMHQYGQLFAQNFTKAQIYLNQAIANQPESKMFFTMHLKFVSIHKFFVTNYSVIRKIVLISILILMILSVKNLF